MTTAPIQLSTPYRSTYGLSKWIIFFLIALIVGVVIVLLTYSSFISRLNAFKNNPPISFFDASLSQAELMRKAHTFDNTYAAFSILSIPTSLIISILLMVWIYKSALNLVFFNIQGLRFSPGWAIGWFFVPVANFVMPPIVLSEIWKASSPGAKTENMDWKRASTSLVILLWWIFMIGMIIFPIMLLLIAPENQEQLANGDFSSMTTRLWVVSGLQIGWAACLISLVRSITARQADKQIYMSAESRMHSLNTENKPSLPLVEPFQPPSQFVSEIPPQPLTEEEQKVLILLSERRTNTEIARILNIPLSQIESLIDVLYNKFDVNSDIDLIWKARETGHLPA